MKVGRKMKEGRCKEGREEVEGREERREEGRNEGTPD